MKNVNVAFVNSNEDYRNLYLTDDKGLEELEVSFHRQSKDKFVLDDPEKKRSSLKFCFLTSGQVNQAQHRKYCRV